MEAMRQDPETQHWAEHDEARVQSREPGVSAEDEQQPTESTPGEPPDDLHAGEPEQTAESSSAASSTSPPTRPPKGVPLNLSDLILW